jgi:hypothetical protein
MSEILFKKAGLCKIMIWDLCGLIDTNLTRYTDMGIELINKEEHGRLLEKIDHLPFGDEKCGHLIRPCPDKKSKKR